MRPGPSSLPRAILCLSFLFLVGELFSQEVSIQPRIVQTLDESHLTTLRGNVHPLALARFDRGAAPPSMPLNRMLLVLKRSPEQEAALLRLLDEQQDKSSPNYHKWLQPEEFGKRFGPADADVQAVTSWLQTHGFQINQVSKGRSVIEISGTAAMVQEAFHTALHKYVVGNSAHWANATDPQVPSALTPVLAGVWTLHNFQKKPMLRVSSEHFPLTYPPGAKQPLATGSNGHHFLSPGDFSVIYGINPVYQSGINGTGATIGVVGRSDFNPGDVLGFFGIFGISRSISILANGPDPGNLGGGEEAEAVLDATWSGALAPGASVQFVVSASTDTTDGVDLSELYIVDNNLADIMTESFGICEPHVSSAEQAGMNALAQQAAAQGITYILSSGDTGAEGCDHLSSTIASGPVAVSAPAATPFNTAVGGTMFDENGHDSTYWSASTSTPVTALKYIPEKVWNESCTSASCGSNANIAAGGGGASTVVAKPSWQSGSNLHIPNDGFRDVPDISLTSASHDPYLLCLAGSCSQQGFLVGISGTSAAAPSFAGIMALVVQKTGSRVGLANYVLYRLANSQSLSQCNGSNTTTAPAASCIFNDVTVGNNAVPGEPGFGGASPQYTSAAGFDLATGLGSLKVNNLVNGWSTATFNPTTTTLTLTPTTITHGSAINATITVSPSSGSTQPTGNVSVIASPASQAAGFGTLTLSNGTASGAIHTFSGGTYAVRAHYAGDANFAPSDSADVSLTISAENSTTTVRALTADSNGLPIPLTSVPYGTYEYLRADVEGQSGFGFATGAVNFLDNVVNTVEGNPYTLNSQANTAPPNGLYRFAPGTHSITASYLGDVSFNPSMSAPVSFSVTKADALPVLTTSPATAVSPTTDVTLTATINTISGGLAPEGSVTFFNGSTFLGSGPIFGETAGGVTTTGTFVTAHSTATLVTQLPIGQTNLTAQYSGDPDYNAATSPPVGLTVALDFSLAFSGTSGNSLTIASPGSSGNLTLTVTGQTGYTGTVNFAANACSGLPLGAACSFTPPSVTGSGSTTLRVTTIAPHAVSPAETMARLGMATAGGMALATIFVAGAMPRKRLWKSLLGLLLLAWMLTIVGCSGGSSGGGSGTPGTPPGTYQVTATGSDGTFSHPVTFRLTIQ